MYCTCQRNSLALSLTIELAYEALALMPWCFANLDAIREAEEDRDS